MIQKRTNTEDKIYFLGSTIFVALIMTCSLLWNIYTTDSNTFQLVKSIGQSFFKEIETTRFWNASHGGVYIPISEKTQPTPYLKVPKAFTLFFKNRSV